MVAWKVYRGWTLKFTAMRKMDRPALMVAMVVRRPTWVLLGD
jgi:hypothetical protein